MKIKWQALTFLNVVSFLVVCLALLLPKPGHAAPYTQTVGGCYDVGNHVIVAAVFCAATSTRYSPALAAAQIAALSGDVASLNSTTDKTEELTNVDSCSQEGEGGVTKVTTGAISSGPPSVLTEQCANGASYTRSQMVKPSTTRLSSAGVFVTGGVSSTHLDGSQSPLNDDMRMNTNQVVVGLSRDFGDWGYTALLPMSRTNNSASYSAFNSTRVGLVVSPVYHMLKEQVHGMTLDIGGVLGYQHTQFSDVAAVRSTAGAFGYADFDNVNTTSFGLFARLSKPIADKTRIALALQGVGMHNDSAGATLGDNNTVLSTSALLTHQATEHLTLSGGLRWLNMRLPSFNTSANYGVVDIGVGYLISPRTSLQFSLNRTVSNQLFSNTSGMFSVNFQMQ